ncbi:MAG: hypothetical protein M3256_27080, partial [Actinomycetota bacterium]|nr:hypothetical protein [Actinomycetota bacterium]
MTLVEEPTANLYAHEIVPGDVPGGPSTSQTIMVASLQRLLSQVPPHGAPQDYRSAVIDENVLGKQTVAARGWAFRQLRRFYGFDSGQLLFRALRDLWPDDGAGQPLLAMLCALARDPVLRASTAVIFGTDYGAEVAATDFAPAIEEAFPGSYNDNTRRTAAQNMASSWQQSGHLSAETVTKKTRCRAECTPADLSYALLLGHLQGARGQGLFKTLWSRVLDQPTSRLFDLAATASQRGMLDLRHAGGVT